MVREYRRRVTRCFVGMAVQKKTSTDVFHHPLRTAVAGHDFYTNGGGQNRNRHHACTTAAARFIFLTGCISPFYIALTRVHPRSYIVLTRVYAPLLQDRKNNCRVVLFLHHIIFRCRYFVVIISVSYPSSQHGLYCTHAHLSPACRLYQPDRCTA